MDENERLELRIRGRVQGVGFRWSAQSAARSRGVRGWVRNEPDASVLLVAEGTRPALEDFLTWCRAGPPSARVSAVQVHWTRAVGDVPSSFEIRR